MIEGETSKPDQKCPITGPEGTTAIWAWIGSLAANIGNLIFALATGVLTARLLLPVGRGELAEVLFWASYVAMLGIFALPSALVVHVARDRSDRSVAPNALMLAIVLSGASVCAFFVLNWLALGATLTRTTTLYICAFVPVNHLSLVLIAIDQADKRFTRYNLLRLIPQSIYLVGLLVICTTGRLTVDSCLLCVWTGYFCVIAVRLPFSFRSQEWRISIKKMTKLLREGTSFHLAALTTILLQFSDQFAVIKLFDHKSLGLYVVAMSASGVALGTITMATNAVMLPKLASVSDHNRQRTTICRALCSTLIISIICNLLMAAATPLVISHVFGASYFPACKIAIVLCAMQIPLSYVSVGTVAMRATGDWLAGVIAPLAGLCTFAALVLPFTHLFGILGVAVTIFAAWLAAMAVTIWRIVARFRISAFDCLFVPYAGIKAQISEVRHAVTRKRQLV